MTASCTLVSILVLGTFFSCRALQDLLSPYSDHHGPKYRNHREIRDCQHIKYGNRTHYKIAAHSNVDIYLPLVKSQHQLIDITTYFNKRTALVLLETVNNPLQTFSVLEPNAPGTCGNGSWTLATVRESARQKSCILATNAGFFDTHSGECLGNVISDGRFVRDSGGVQNVHMGITEDGYIYVGYLSELDLLTQQFRQLIGGVLWLVREGETYVYESIKIECSDTEETGTLQAFASVQSARMAVGHDKHGRILIAHVDGKTGLLGVNLYEFSTILLDLGFVNAINLDGGGSATVILNNTLVNYPSDKCSDKQFNCERPVSTILCVSEPTCADGCTQHGDCRMGVCQCHMFWSGRSCDTPSCPQNCSDNGDCTSDGCYCSDGWHGNDCATSCSEGSYGFNCSRLCCCQNAAHCDIVTGECQCQPGFYGDFCQSVCPYGFYGDACTNLCNCDTSCFCHHVTGSCNLTEDPHSFTDYIEAGSCVARRMIAIDKLVPDQSDQYRLCLTSSIILSIIAAISVVINISLVCRHVTARRQLNSHSDELVKTTLRKFVFHNSPDQSESESESGEMINLYQAPTRKGRS